MYRPREDALPSLGAWLVLGLIMSPETAALCSTIPTPKDVTGEGTLFRVNASMSLEIVDLCSPVPTPKDVTGEGLLSRVNTLVHLEMGLQCSTIPTPRAFTNRTAASRVEPKIVDLTGMPPLSSCKRLRTG